VNRKKGTSTKKKTGEWKYKDKLSCQRGANQPQLTLSSKKNNRPRKKGTKGKKDGESGKKG